MSVAFNAWDYEVTYLELIACILALTAVGLAAFGKRIAWPFYFLSALAYGYLFLQFDLLASAILQVVFMGAAIWGWFDWGKGGLREPRSLTWRMRGMVVVGAVVMWLVLTPVLAAIGATATILDAFVLIGSIVAQVLMVKGFTEAWIAWVIVNVVGTYHYAHQDLYFTGLLYFILLLLGIWGWWKWARSEQAAPVPAAQPTPVAN